MKNMIEEIRLERNVVFGITLILLLMAVWAHVGVPNTDRLKVFGSGAPRVVSTSPARNELGVPVDTDISVTFDVDMNELTIDSSTFVVNARCTGRHEGTIRYDSKSKTATFDPDIYFDVGEVVTVVLTKEIRSLDGTPMEKSYAWSFTVLVEGGGVGAGTFDPPLNYAVGESAVPTAVFAADLNGDGDIDLATANPGPTAYGPDTVSVLLNNGCEGLFFDYEQYPASGEDRGLVTSVFAADLDGDGDLDLAMGNIEAHNVSVLLNEGGGTFAPYQDYSLESEDKEPYSILAADLDGDGDLDLATANSGANNVSVLFNNGDGTFSLHGDYQVGSTYPRLICSADVDNDGDIDLVTTNMLSHQGTVLLNNGDGTFEDNPPHQVFSTGNYPHTVFAADLNSDNYLDLAVANWGSDTVSVLLNNGDGTFAIKVDYSVSQHPRSVFAADLDGDGDLDLATANESQVTSDTVSVLLNNGDGTFGAKQDYSIGNVVDAGPKSIFAADLDGDTDLDLVTANGGYNNVSILLNKGSPFFPSGNFRFATVEMTLRTRRTNLLSYTRTLDSKVEVHDMDETGGAGYTDHHGNVTFLIAIQCKDRSTLFDASFIVWAKVYEYEGGPLIKRSDWWIWDSSWERTKKCVFKAFTLNVPTSRTYYIIVKAGIAPFFIWIPFWWDEDGGDVSIISRYHPVSYQQTLKICWPHHMATYTMGTDEWVHVLVQYYNENNEYFLCTNTPVSICIMRGKYLTEYQYNGQTDESGRVHWKFNIPKLQGYLLEGNLTIIAGDLPKDTGFTMSPGDSVDIQAVNPKDANTFGVFAVPHSCVLPGGSTNYTVGVGSINFEGDVTLSVADLPPGTSGVFAPPSLTVPYNKTVISNLTISTASNTPLGLHQFTISATNGTLTINFPCPLMVGAGEVSLETVNEMRDIECNKQCTSIPMITHICICLNCFNELNAPVTVNWELWLDDKLWQTGTWSAPPGLSYVCVQIANWSKISPCVHTWHLKETSGVMQYETHRVLAILVGDVNCDSIVDMKDIFAMIRAFGSRPGMLRWNPACDINNDGKADLIDIYNGGILNFNKKCLC